MIMPSRPNILDNATPVATPDQAEVAFAIHRLKFNNASGYDGLPAELFKQVEMSGYLQHPYGKNHLRGWFMAQCHNIL